MANTLTVDIVDMTVPPLRPVRIAIVSKPNPVTAEPVTGEQLLQLIQFPKYKITETATGKVVNGGNIYEYFPELQPGGGGGGGGGGVTPAQVQAMINSSIDSTVSASSTNAIKNSCVFFGSSLCFISAITSLCCSSDNLSMVYYSFFNIIFRSLAILFSLL